ncbi:hypothetical protein QCA50_010141 [Cerrena zonata]|uniref:DUF6534 domain-containing protein n=1 Tax=Cerrena zonata TaxID=2478898 RepID=A0AAW0FZV8_9APHY
MSGVRVDNTLGAGFVSCIFVAILYGITLLQCFIYAQNCKNDAKILKGTCQFNEVIENVTSLKPKYAEYWIPSTSYALYWYTITHYDDPHIVSVIPWMIPVGVLILTPINDGIIRLWFLYRIWIRKGLDIRHDDPAVITPLVVSESNRILVSALGLLSFGVLGIGVGFGCKGTTLKTFPEFAKFSWILYVGLGMLMFVDVCMAGTLVWLLYRKRLTVVSKRTDSVINTIMAYIIHTGLLTSVLTISCFITYATMPKNYVFLALYFPQSKLYLNSFLASLNARESLKREMQPDPMQRLSWPRSSLRENPRNSPIVFKQPNSLPIAMISNKTTETRDQGSSASSLTGRDWQATVSVEREVFVTCDP